MKLFRIVGAVFMLGIYPFLSIPQCEADGSTNMYVGLVDAVTAEIAAEVPDGSIIAHMTKLGEVTADYEDAIRVWRLKDGILSEESLSALQRALGDIREDWAPGMSLFAHRFQLLSNDVITARVTVDTSGDFVLQEYGQAGVREQWTLAYDETADPPWIITKKEPGYFRLGED